MAKPTYKVIYNQDDSTMFLHTEEPLTPGHVDRMVDEVADGGADAMLICANAQRTSYPSKVWETDWDGYEAAFDKSTAAQKHGLKQLKLLAKKCDYMQRALARCRKRGITPGVSIRMNDMHGFPDWPDSAMFSKFYREHPELQMDGKIKYRSYSSRGLNYAHPQVRDHYLKLIGELATEYDVELMELDFQRFPAFFDRGDTQGNCRIMTGFIEEVRKLLTGTGRKINLVPRLAATPSGAHELGFDVRTWAQAGLVDGISVSQFLCTGWELPIDQFRELVGPDIAIYACSDYSARYNTPFWKGQGLLREPLPTNRELIRGFAAGYLAFGADGINLFNFFCAREGRESVSVDPDFAALSEMSDLDSLRAKPRRHLLTAGFHMLECDLPLQIPIALSGIDSRQFHMVLAAEAPGQQVTVRVNFAGAAEPKDIWLLANYRAVGHAVDISAGPSSEPKTSVARFALPEGVIRDGRNEFIVRHENDEKSINILGIDVIVS